MAIDDASVSIRDKANKDKPNGIMQTGTILCLTYGIEFVLFLAVLENSENVTSEILISEVTSLLRYHEKHRMTFVDWLVGCFGLNGPLRQYFSLYRAVSQREGERKEK